MVKYIINEHIKKIKDIMNEHIKKMKDIIINQVYEICPCLQVYSANKKIQKKKEDICEKHLRGSSKVLYLEYTASIERRNRLEDKAKSLLISWTITSTIILGLPTMMKQTIVGTYCSISDMPMGALFIDIITIVCLLSVVYMFFAGLMVIQILTKDNQVSLVSASDRKNRRAIYQATKENDYQNIIRNNKLSAAYQFLRNSFFCLVILFFVVVLIG